MLAEFNSSDVTYEVYWTINSSYMSFVSYNATSVTNDFKRQMRRRENMTVRLLLPPDSDARR